MFACEWLPIAQQQSRLPQWSRENETEKKRGKGERKERRVLLYFFFFWDFSLLAAAAMRSSRRF